MYSNKERMVRKFNNFHQPGFRVFATGNHTGFFKLLQVFIIKFPAMPVAFTDERSSINLISKEPSLIHMDKTQAAWFHLSGNFLLFFHQVNYRVCSIGSISVECASVKSKTFLANSMTAICIPRQIPKNGKLFSLAYLTAMILPSTPLMPKPGATSNPSRLSKFFTYIFFCNKFTVHIYNLHLAIIHGACMNKRFQNGFISILQFNIFTDQADGNFTVLDISVCQEILSICSVRFYCNGNINFLTRSDQVFPASSVSGTS